MRCWLCPGLSLQRSSERRRSHLPGPRLQALMNQVMNRVPVRPTMWRVPSPVPFASKTQKARGLRWKCLRVRNYPSAPGFALQQHAPSRRVQALLRWGGSKPLVPVDSQH